MTYHWEVNADAVRDSSQIVMEAVSEAIGGTRSVIDIGCGSGIWLDTCSELGVDDCHGIDNGIIPDFIERPWGEIHKRDIKTYDAKRKYDLAVCLEVAEHLPAQYALHLVKLLTDLSDTVLFCAATPGQGGDGHVNEMPHEYWHTLFKMCGYMFHDTIRPQICGNEDVLPWYRDNIFIYTREVVDGEEVVL